jgi:type 1 fimbriae regulatory protein FimB
MAGAATKRQATVCDSVTLHEISKAQVCEWLLAAKAIRERDYVMFLMAFLHGLRISEVLALLRDDIADGFVNIRSLKGSNHAHQMLFTNPEPLLDERKVVEKYLKSNAFLGTDRLFPITRQHAWRLSKKYGKLAGIPEHLCHPHTLRHSIAHELVGIIDINELQRHMRHKSLASTGEYLKVGDAKAGAAVQSALKSPKV